MRTALMALPSERSRSAICASSIASAVERLEALEQRRPQKGDEARRDDELGKPGELVGGHLAPRHRPLGGGAEQRHAARHHLAVIELGELREAPGFRDDEADDLLAPGGEDLACAGGQRGRARRPRRGGRAPPPRRPPPRSGRRCRCGSAPRTAPASTGSRGRSCPWRRPPVPPPPRAAPARSRSRRRRRARRRGSPAPWPDARHRCGPAGAAPTARARPLGRRACVSVAVRSPGASPVMTDCSVSSVNEAVLQGPSKDTSRNSGRGSLPLRG